MESVPADDNGLKVCYEDGFELEDGFPDISAQKEIMLSMCFCKNQIEGCAWSGPLIDLQEHLDQCEYKIDLPCKYRGVNCAFVGGRIARKNHMEDSELWHQNLILGEVKKISKDIGVNKYLMETIAFENQALAVNSITDDLEKLTVKIEQDDLGDFDMDYDSLTFVQEIQDIENVRDYVLSQQQQLTQALEETYKLVELVRDNHSAPINLDERVSQLQLKASRLNSTHTHNRKTMREVDLKAKLFQSTTFDGTYTWKLDNLQSRQMDALTGKTPELFTPPLHTSRYGYKFCAKLLLNGSARVGERSQHIALYLILMKGDYDDTLQWPFPHTVKVTLMSKYKKNNIENFLVPQPQLPHFQKPYKEMNPSIGFACFCSLDSLYSDGYVMDDSLYIKIEKAD